jgi:hypothetical protein
VLIEMTNRLDPVAGVFSVFWRRRLCEAHDLEGDRGKDHGDELAHFS